MARPAPIEPARIDPAPVDPASLDVVLRPIGQARTLPGAAYCSAAVFEWERRHFFAGSWVCAGRAADLPAAGDQSAVRVGGVGVLLVRDGTGALRGFFNACRHRGHELLAPGGTRHARGIRCPYHDWVYGLAGECRATPRFDPAGAARLEREEFALVPVRIAEWHGWVFVNVSGAAPTLAEHLGNLDVAVADYGPERLVRGASSEYEVAANWKIVVENYLECYHCASIHPELCAVSPPDSGRGYPEPARGAWVGGPLALRAGAETMSLTGASGGRPIATVPPERCREVGYAALLPNLLISPHPDYLMTHRLEPLAADRTLVGCDWYFPVEAADRPGFDPAYAVEFWDVVNRQDWAACESVQRNTGSPGWRQGPFSPWETDVWAVAGAVARGYRTGRLAAPSDQAARQATERAQQPTRRAAQPTAASTSSETSKLA